MPSAFSFATLDNRLIIQARLVMDSALHIGSGEESGSVDAGIVLDRDGHPYIPGSSLKGVLRSEAERAAALLGQTGCGLFSSNGVNCLTTDDDSAQRFRSDIRKARGLTPGLHAQIEQELCDTCKLFGSQFAASRLQIDDLPMIDADNFVIESRDGVGIDRDTGTAAQHIKYDFHVVPAGAEFTVRIQAENLDARSRALLAFVILELNRGSYSLGGKRSRGLGRCHLVRLQIQEFDFSKPEALLVYLSAKSSNLNEDGSLAFLKDSVKKGLTHA